MDVHSAVKMDMLKPQEIPASATQTQNTDAAMADKEKEATENLNGHEVKEEYKKEEEKPVQVEVQKIEEDPELLKAVAYRDEFQVAKKRCVEQNGHEVVSALDAPAEVDMKPPNAGLNIVVGFSKVKAPNGIQLNENRSKVTSWKGFRTVRTDTGIAEGTWLCEAHISHLGGTGHVRLGFCTAQAESQAPVGFDMWGYGLRDVDGSKIHRAKREPYAEGFVEGDRIGMLIHLPNSMSGSTDRVEKETAKQHEQLPGSFVAFIKNGKYLGPAFTDISVGTYYPAVSIYTMPEQKEGATVSMNFGPSFSFAIQDLQSIDEEIKNVIKPLQGTVANENVECNNNT